MDTGGEWTEPEVRPWHCVRSIEELIVGHVSYDRN